MVKIEKATRDDVSVILHFITELAKYERMRKYVKATEKDIERNIFEDKRAEVILLKMNDKAIGFAVYYYAFSTFLARPTLHLEDFFVEKEERGKGYGKKVLSWLSKEALDNGCLRFEWNCLEWNKPSMRFYEALGAKPLRGWIPYRLDGKELARMAEEE